ncbi:uncharacterized protein CBL_02052 [Carabus blaptoides fortunei]
MDKDERFKHITTDPKFRRIPKAERKVKIDKRFQSMFKDDKFKLKYTIDKRGRPFNHTSSEDLKRYYDLSSEEESSNSDDESQSDEQSEAGKYVRSPAVQAENQTNDLDKKHKLDKVVPNNIKAKLKDLSVDYARGEGALISESSSDDDDDSGAELSDSEEVDHGWGELDKDAERTDEVTNRLAVCNLDWDRMRATDLMVLFNSFLPSGGVINSVTIYPSDFGIQRMKEEEVKGPIELVDGKNVKDGSDDEETEEGSKYHMEKLRQYQLNRLKYYYAVVVCDTPETANKIYTECDGLEYESSATKIDLRFVPDGTEFENEPKEICGKMPEKYQPRFFTTTALQQAKVELTWDETNPERLEIAKKLSDGKVDDVTETDLQAYLASSSGEENEDDQIQASDDENDNKNPIDKYRSLLQDIQKSEQEKENKGVEMEITWGVNMKEKSEKLVKKKLAESEEKTPFQQYLDKKKEKIKTKREERKKKLKGVEENSENDSDDIPSDIDMNDPYFAEEFDKPEFKKKKSKSKSLNEDDEESSQKNAELELLLLNENEDTKKHFSLKKIQEQENVSGRKKRKNKNRSQEDGTQQEDDFELNVKDDRFSALYSSHHFNIDPTDPHYRKTKGMEALITEKLKRRTEETDLNTNNKKPKVADKKDAELSVLVKSIKRKTQAHQVKK